MLHLLVGKEAALACKHFCCVVLLICAGKPFLGCTGLGAVLCWFIGIVVDSGGRLGAG